MSSVRSMFICAVLAVFIAGNMPTHAFADATDCPKGMSELDCDAINGPWPAWIPDSGDTCESQPTDTTALGKNSSVYVLGDSITVRAESAYTKAFGEKDIKTDINAAVGRSWKNPGSGKQTGAQAVEADQAEIEKADGIVIALGSNGGLESNPIDEVIAAIRQKNPSAPIWWVNVTGTNAWKGANLKSYMGTFNKALDDAATKTTFKVIDWASELAPGSDQYNDPGTAAADPDGLLEDGLHPNKKGVSSLSDLVVTAVSGTSTDADEIDLSSCCGASSSSLQGSNRAEQIWNFFIGNGLKPIAVAGIMGNFAQEDGPFDPARKQGDSIAAIPDGGDGVTGYGIAQWTSQGRQAGLFKEIRQAGLEKYYGAGWGHPEIDKEIPQKDIDALLLIELNYAWSGDSTKIKDIAKQLNAAKSIRGENGSTILFHRVFEASADNASQIQERVDSAAVYLKKYRSTSGSALSSTGCAGGLGGVSTMEDAIPWADRFIQDARKQGAQSRKLNQKHTGDLWSLYVTSDDESSLCWTNDCEQCTAASAWFIAKMTKYPEGTASTTGNGWQVVYSLKSRGVPTGNKPQPFSVFSWGSGVGHTGVVLGVLENGQVITLENNWPNGTLVVRKYDIKKDYPDVRFAYFADKMKVDVNNDAANSE